MKGKPSRPTTSNTMNHPLSGRFDVLSTAPIQATNCAIAPAVMTSTPNPMGLSRVQARGLRLIPVTSDPFITKMSLAKAKPVATPIRMRPPTSPIRLPKNSLLIIDLLMAQHLHYHCAPEVVQRQEPIALRSSNFSRSSPQRTIGRHLVSFGRLITGAAPRLE